MKTKHLLVLQVILTHLVFTAIAQTPSTNKNVGENIPSDSKFTLADHNKIAGSVAKFIPPGEINNSFISKINYQDKNAIKKHLDEFRQQLESRKSRQPIAFHDRQAGINRKGESAMNTGFHLTRDINAVAESYPQNYQDFGSNPTYTILNDVMYFSADDGIHGFELWRSDGTAEGTSMVMDVDPGSTPSSPYNITAANGKLYFSAYTLAYGWEAWVSNGTQNGTHLLMDIKQGAESGAPTQFVEMGKDVYFVANGVNTLSGIWKTDGTPEGTKLVKNLGDSIGGEYITQLTTSNGLLFFTFYSYVSNNFELWRSDGNGSDEGTYKIGLPIAAGSSPGQLTNLNNKLYFSSSDSTGRKLWVSDGTEAGTTYAPHNNNILIEDFDYFGIHFPVLHNALYLADSSHAGGRGLYKYDPSNSAGLVKIKDFSQGSDPDFIVPSEMEIVGNILYFKVAKNNGGVHDELWSSGGNEASTKLIKKFGPGETFNNLTNGGGSLYFVKYDATYGAELWKFFDNPVSPNPVLVHNIFKGAGSSNPTYLTPFHGQLFFSATDELKGNELFVTKSFGFDAALVKDINTITTGDSWAGLGGFRTVNVTTSVGGNALFSATDKLHGTELFRSDGTKGGTYLVNDIIPGDVGALDYFGGVFGYRFLAKNNAAYFVGRDTGNSYSIYKTNGTKSGLHRIVTSNYFIQDFKIADNGLIYYVLFNPNTNSNELWRTDKTSLRTFLLAPALDYYSYLSVAGNNALFVASDSLHGSELWKSDGSAAGTGILKDINPGVGSGSPGGMVPYRNEFYFAAFDSVNHGFWKTDGTKKNTVMVKNIDPWWERTVYTTEHLYYTILNNILYFSAVSYPDSMGSGLWRTDGTAKGTRLIKDIDTLATGIYPVPTSYTNVNGTIFFIADDGVHGTELWKSDGTKKGTILVKDIAPGINSSYPDLLTSFAGKLFFTSNGILWSSDGTEDGTQPVDDPGIGDVWVYNIFPAGNKLFLTGYNYRYGTELYACEINGAAGKIVASRIANVNSVKIASPFTAVLYPNPSLSNSTLQITGNTRNISVFITDIRGKKLWQNNRSRATSVKLPVEKFVAGTYFVTVTNDIESKTLKFIKQ